MRGHAYWDGGLTRWNTRWNIRPCLAALTPLSLPRDPLFAYITTRSVQRRPVSRRLLTPREKSALEASVGNLYKIVWLDGAAAKWQVAKLLRDNAQLRLSIKEAYEVHKRIFDWGKQFSVDKIPDQSLGADFLTLKLMRWVLGSWPRVKFFNKFLAGTLMPRIQLDLLPALGCGAHFALVSAQGLETMDDYLASGRALQRFWLTATGFGLQLQPEMTPLIFSRYARTQRNFSSAEGAMQHAQRINQGLEALIGDAVKQRTAFFGRIGQGKTARSRSLRLPLPRLMR